MFSNCQKNGPTSEDRECIIKTRTKIVILLGIATLAGIWLARNALSHKALASVLTSHAPTPSAMEAFVASAPDRTAAFHQLWNTHRLPQRHFVMASIRKDARTDPALWQSLRPLVLEAATLADSELQSDVLIRLMEHNDAELAPAAYRDLASPDPETRSAGLLRLMALKDPRWIAVFVRMLDDPEYSVRALAAAGLRGLTTLDFGMRNGSSPEVLAEGIGKWKEWWQTTGAKKYAEAPPPAVNAETSPGLSHPITLKDLSGKTVSLADFKGKVVLLNFWATWCPTCLPELGDLQKVQSRHPDDFVVLSINVDGISEDHEDHDHTDHESMAELQQRLDEIRQTVEQAKVQFPVLLDPEGTTIGAYVAGSLPTNILISPDGKIRRRMLGTRPERAWDVLIEDARGKGKE